MNANEPNFYRIGFNDYKDKTSSAWTVPPSRKKDWQRGWNDACTDNNEAVLWLNDKIIDHGRLSLVTYFFDHLVKASKVPLDFVFAHGSEKWHAQEWLAFHANRLNMPMRGLLILRTRDGSQSHVIIPEDVCYYV